MEGYCDVMQYSLPVLIILSSRGRLCISTIIIRKVENKSAIVRKTQQRINYDPKQFDEQDQLLLRQQTTTTTTLTTMRLLEPIASSLLTPSF